MRILVCGIGAAILVVFQPTPLNPERLLAERLQFSSNELARAGQGQPVVKVKADGAELSAVGALRLPGKKERLSDWVRNIQHFRQSADLGVAQAVPAQPTVAAFAGVTLDAKDVEALKQCNAGKCAMRVPAEAFAEMQRNGMANANEVFRRMLLAEMAAYIRNGNAYAVAPLLQKAATLTAVSPELAAFIERYPAATLPAADQLFYWASTPAGSVSIVSLHHLVVYKPHSGEIWIADKNVYASRYFDTGVLVIGLYDAADGNGFYAVAGSRARSGYLAGAAGSLLRRQIQRSASDTVKVYLEWLRDSLSAAPGL